MGAAASLHSNLEAHVKNMDAKELARFARENKINTYVTETIKLHDIDGNTAIALENDDLGDMAPNSKLNKKKLIVALNLLKDAVEVPASKDKSDDHAPIDYNLMDHFNNGQPNTDVYIEHKNYAILTITISSAENLKKTDGLFSSQSGDPYVKVLFDEKHVGTTKVIKKNSNPQWNEKILLKLPHNFDFSKSTLSLQIYDHDTISSHDFLGQVKLIGEEIYNTLDTCNFDDDEELLTYRLRGEEEEEESDGTDQEQKNVCNAQGSMSFRLNLEYHDDGEIDGNDWKKSSMIRNTSRVSNRSTLNSRGSIYSSSAFYNGDRSYSRQSLRSSMSRLSISSSMSRSTMSGHNREKKWFDDNNCLRQFQDVQTFINSIEGVHIETDLHRKFQNLNINDVEDIAHMVPEKKAKIIGSRLRSATNINGGIGKIFDLKRNLRWKSFIDYLQLVNRKIKFTNDDVGWIIEEFESRSDSDDIIDFGREIERKCNVNQILDILSKREKRMWIKHKVVTKARQYVRAKKKEMAENKSIARKELNKLLKDIGRNAAMACFVGEWVGALNCEGV